MTWKNGICLGCGQFIFREVLAENEGYCTGCKEEQDALRRQREERKIENDAPHSGD